MFPLLRLAKVGPGIQHRLLFEAAPPSPSSCLAQGDAIPTSGPCRPQFTWAPGPLTQSHGHGTTLPAWAADPRPRPPPRRPCAARAGPPEALSRPGAAPRRPPDRPAAHRVGLQALARLDGCCQRHRVVQEHLAGRRLLHEGHPRTPVRHRLDTRGRNQGRRLPPPARLCSRHRRRRRCQHAPPHAPPPPAALAGS